MALGAAQPPGRPDLSGRDRFRRALTAEAVAFAPIVWARLPELVHQEHVEWWRRPELAQRLIADAAALAAADAMFVFVADEAVRCAVNAGQIGDDAIDALARSPATVSGAELVACLREVAEHAVIAALPPAPALSRALAGDEPEPAQDAFTDLAFSYLEAGADAIAVVGDDAGEVTDALARAAGLGKLFDRPVLAICSPEGSAVTGWTDTGMALGVVTDAAGWPSFDRGVVITDGDVSSRWDAAALREVGIARR